MPGAAAPQPSLAELLGRHAAERPQAACLTAGEERLTFADLEARSARLAGALQARGVGHGDRVALLAPTSPVFYELAFACARLGAIMAPLNWRLSPREIAGIVADAEPRLILADAALRGLLGATPDLPPVIDLDAEYTSWRDAAEAVALDGAPVADDPVLLLYTSGTTGRPKGVMITNGNLSYVERTAREAWGFSAASVNLVAMPLFHIGGIGYGMMALSQGGQTVLLPQPDPMLVSEAIVRHGVTHAFFVPTVIQRLVESAEARPLAPSSLQRIVYGAAPIGEALLKRAMAAFGCGLDHAYGMTETAGTVITMSPEEHQVASRLRSCGRALPWVELALVDPASGQAVAAGEVGEICIRSGMVMRGYWRKPEETAAVLSPDGWLRTGDAAFQDPEGFVYIHDRYKDMIVSGGENIYPTEIENVLQEHADIAEVAVIGVPHPRWGETPRACVVLRPGRTAGEAELIAYARSRLAHYKCPTSVVFLDALPRNASAKVLKQDLRLMHGVGS